MMPPDKIYISNALLDATELEEKHFLDDIEYIRKEALLDWFNSFIESLEQKPNIANVDEAAEEYAPDFSNDFASKSAVEAVREAFKAGAIYMAERGYTTETTVRKTPLNGPVGICINLNHDLTGFKDGDEVIIQIRKK